MNCLPDVDSLEEIARFSTSELEGEEVEASSVLPLLSESIIFWGVSQEEFAAKFGVGFSIDRIHSLSDKVDPESLRS